MTIKVGDEEQENWVTIKSMKLPYILAFILACSVLSCYPAYNWRLVQTEQFGWEALFPAKPKRNSRKIIIHDHSKQTVIKIDRYSVALNQMDFILDVISFEGEMLDNASSLQEYVNIMLKTNLNIPPGVRLVDGVLIEGFIGKGESEPVAMILKHLSNDYSMVRGVAVGSPQHFISEKAEFFLNSIK
ncbi:MAG: hypothetical protein VXA09_06090 [Burkholderiaceae bacterium]